MAKQQRSCTFNYIITQVTTLTSQKSNYTVTSSSDYEFPKRIATVKESGGMKNETVADPGYNFSYRPQYINE